MRLRFLRPPGAVAEREFLGRCLQCGQCAQVCPFHAITLRTGFNPLTAGTPQILPPRAPCRLCMRCPPVCPSGALRQVDITGAGMGRARLDRHHCYTWSGMIVCRSCFENCPLKGSAIVLARGIYPVVTGHCVGCGVCEYVCPNHSITTIPRRML